MRRYQAKEWWREVRERIANRVSLNVSSSFDGRVIVRDYGGEAESHDVIAEGSRGSPVEMNIKPSRPVVAKSYEARIILDGALMRFAARGELPGRFCIGRVVFERPATQKSPVQSRGTLEQQR